MKRLLWRLLVRLRWSAAAAAPAKHTHTHTQRYIIGQRSAQFTVSSSSCMIKCALPAFSPHLTLALLRLLLRRPHTALKINRARRFPPYVLPPHTQTQHVQTAAQESSQPAGNSFSSKKTKSPNVSHQELAQTPSLINIQ